MAYRGRRVTATSTALLVGPLMLMAPASAETAAGVPPAVSARVAGALAVVGVAPAGGAQVVLDRMSEAQRIGQLFMVGGPATGVGTATTTAVQRYHVGSVILTGRSYGGVAATRRITNGLQSLATSSATLGVPLYVAADQEGGYVQVLQDGGFSRMPTALTQGTWPSTTLKSAAKTWGGQLKAAGVNLNLAPVMDTVTAAFAPYNPPIGYYDREFGYTSTTVADKGTAFLRGMRAAGVSVSIKHFPGLGRVSGNTDTTSGVTDTITTRTSAYINPFRSGVVAGSPFVMMSTAYYSRIDAAHPAAFSSTIINGMVRGDLGFKGVVISDDLGSAEQVQAWSPGTRATNFIGAGGDMVLTVDPAVLPSMVAAVSAKAAGDPTFRAKVDAAALRVLKAKQAQGLIPKPSVRGDYDGDGRADVAVFRPSTGRWYVLGQFAFVYGRSGDVPVPGDYNGDGRADVAVFRPSTGQWFVLGHRPVHYGQSGDRPVPGDYNGDGRTDLAVFRPSTGQWFVLGHAPVRYGQPGDLPVPGDYNSDGRTDLAVFRPSTGRWYVLGQFAFVYGRSGDVPVPGDYNGDGQAEVAVFRPSTGQWFVLGHPPVHYGQAGDVPVPRDYNGDGRDDIAVFRPSTGQWFVLGHAPVHYGQSGDIPVG